MEHMKYLVITRKTGADIFESISVLRCSAYMRKKIKRGMLPGSLAIVWDWPREKRCPTCAKGPNCPAFNTGVIRPCPYYHQKEA